MKKLIVIFLALPVMLLVSCTDSHEETSTVAMLSTAPSKISAISTTSENVSFSIPDTQEALEATKSYKDVMQNKVKLTQKSYKGSYDEEVTYQPFFLNELENNLDIEVPTFDFESFTIIDLDGDNIPEVVIEITVDGYTFIYEILHYDNGTVYGYYFVNRAMQSLKIDGTYIGSSGAADNSILKASFIGNILSQTTLAYSEMTSDYDANDAPIIKYYIANKPSTEQQFDLFINKQIAKQDAPWCDFNETNIEKYFNQ